MRKCKEVPVWFPSFTEGGGFSFVDDTRAKRRLPETARQQHYVVSHNRERCKLLAKPPQQALSIGTAANTMGHFSPKWKGDPFWKMTNSRVN